MHQADFRRIPCDRRGGQAERLLRAAVYAFCSLTRPTRREVQQLDDLALPLVDKASRETRRYIAAALSECASPPPELVRRLCAEPVDVVAPLLVRSPTLASIDLIAIIGRHGLPHARAIGRRSDLDPRVADLIRALEALDAKTSARQEQMSPDGTQTKEQALDAAEETRRKLRAMMLPAAAPSQDASGTGQAKRHRSQWQHRPGCFEKLRSAALTGVPPIFEAALADLLGVTAAQARGFTGEHGQDNLMLAMRALELGEEQAFLLAACSEGRRFAHPEAIRLFLERYRAISPAAASAMVRQWKAAAIPSVLESSDEEASAMEAPANQDDVPIRVLKVS